MRSAIQISLWWESTIRSVICWHHLPAGPPTSASQCSNTVMEQGWTLWPSISFPGHLLNDLRILRFAVGRFLLLFLSLPFSFHRDQSLTAFWSSLLTSTPSPLYPSLWWISCTSSSACSWRGTLTLGVTHMLGSETQSQERKEEPLTPFQPHLENSPLMIHSFGYEAYGPY